MDRRRGTARHILPLLLLSAVGCQTATPAPPSVTALASHQTFWRVPATVQRLAVLYPATSIREARHTYLRLEGATFQLKVLRPSLRIVDRTNLQTILTEQRRQHGGGWSDESAIRLGRLIGADSVLLYQVETPSWRDHILARFRDERPPVLVISKIILVESGEVVFHNVVTTPIEEGGGEAALDRSLVQTITDLQQAFR